MGICSVLISEVIPSFRGTYIFHAEYDIKLIAAERSSSVSEIFPVFKSYLLPLNCSNMLMLGEELLFHCGFVEVILHKRTKCSAFFTDSELN